MLLRLFSIMRLLERGNRRDACVVFFFLLVNAQSADARQKPGVIGHNDKDEQTADQREDPPADVPWDAAGPVDAADGGLRPDPDAPDGGGATTLVVSATSLDLAEASQATFTVALGEAPADDVVVTLTSADPDRLIAEPATLTFTAADHDQPQTVALSARPDDDAVDDAVAVTVAAVGAADVTVDVAIADDDTLGFAITPGLEVDVGEGTSTTVHVALTAAPPGPVAVAVASMSPAEATVAPDALSFDADTWATPQTVTITGTQDVDTSDDGATVTVTAAGLAPASIAVTVVDDDVLGIVLSSTNLGTIAEGNVRVRVGQRYALSGAAEAHRDLEARMTTGSTVLIP